MRRVSPKLAISLPSALSTRSGTCMRIVLELGDRREPGRDQPVGHADRNNAEQQSGKGQDQCPAQQTLKNSHGVEDSET